MDTEDLQVRINGVLPDVNAGANTSLSVFYKGFHLLVDAGNGISEGIRNAGKQLPDAILISSTRKQHTNDLVALTKNKVYCTAESCQRISKDFPSLAGSLIEIQPSKPMEVGPFSVVPVAADNAGDQPGMPGSVIYVIKAGSRKIVAGWDFLKLPNADNSILWNPDLLVLGTETYNEHPSTGMISISEAYNLVRM